MSGKVEEIQNALDSDRLAEVIGQKWDMYNENRREKVAEWKELRNFLFATDTTKTTNSQLPWKNKTTIPKLTQIRDNLHSNYISALFPNDDWMKWEGANLDEETKQKKKAITSYLQTKIRQSDFRSVLSKLLLDYIDYGNVIADVEFVEEYKETEDGERIPQYIGPRVRRHSPYDVVFNPLARSFHDSPKITRYIKTVGELKKEAKYNPSLGYDEEAIKKAEEFRSQLSGYKEADVAKALGFQIDGFGNLQDYYQSGYVELLEFEGDLHDDEIGELLENQIITVIDRSYIIRKEQNPSWIKGSLKVHTGWRKRPDNLWAMGPLDNLVGMQYRIDHLENLKADAMDLSVFPPLLIRGEVHDFEWGPMAEIYLGEDGEVAELGKNLNGVIAAQTEIKEIENKMEEMAGAPRQAMGIRTPGEKTAYEVQALQNAAGRIFQEKITQFEVEVLEPLLNNMLEVSRRYMDASDVVRSIDDDLGVVEFMSITKQDITASGKIRPVGARHFAAQAQMVQNLTQLMNSNIGQMVSPHLSSLQLSKLIEDMLGLGRFELFKENIAVTEQAETQRMMNQMQEEMQLEAETPGPEEPPTGGPTEPPVGNL